jgi:hypothetical protein
MNNPRGRPPDLRKERQRAERKLIISAIVLFVVAGGILVGVIYGWEAIVSALLCLLPGLLGLLLLWLLLRLLERLTDRWN